MGRKRIHSQARRVDTAAIVRDLCDQGHKDEKAFVAGGYGSRATWYRYRKDYLQQQKPELYQAESTKNPEGDDEMTKITKMAAVRQALSLNIIGNAEIASYVYSTYGIKMTPQYVSVYKSVIKNQKKGTPLPLDVPPAIDAPETCLDVMANVLECVTNVPADALICLVRNVNRLGESGLISLIQKATPRFS